VHSAADGAQRSLEAAGRHRSIGIDAHEALARGYVRDLVDEFARMAERDVVDLRLGGAHARQRLEPFVLKRPIDRAQPVRPLRMPRRREVIEAGWMGDEQGRHEVVVLKFGPGA
jgi:hypothetical protein